METMSRGGTGLPTSLSGGGLAHLSIEVTTNNQVPVPQQIWTIVTVIRQI